MPSPAPIAIRQRLAVVGLPATAAAALGACGGSSTSTVTTTTGPTTSSTGTSTTSTTSTTSSTSTSASDLRNTFDTLLRQNLVQQQGLTESQADCVINSLDQALSDAQIGDIISAVQGGGNPPAALKQTIQQAAAPCKNA